MIKFQTFQTRIIRTPDYESGTINEPPQCFVAQNSIVHCALERCRTFLGRYPESSPWWWARLPAPYPRCPCGGRLRWRVTGFWAGWWGVVSADCCGPRWASRWGNWGRGSGCPEARRCGPLWGRSASSEVYCDSCRKQQRLNQQVWCGNISDVTNKLTFLKFQFQNNMTDGFSQIILNVKNYFYWSDSSESSYYSEVFC